MEKFDVKRSRQTLAVSMGKSTFSHELADSLRARNDIPWILLPETEEEGEHILLRFSIEGMKSLYETAADMDNETLREALRETAEKVLSLSRYGMDITQVLTAFDHIMVDAGGICLACLCNEEMPGEKAACRKAMVQQVRQVLLTREGMDDLRSFVANPYCSLEALLSKLENDRKTGPGTENRPEKQETPAEIPVQKAEKELPEAEKPFSGETVPESSAPYPVHPESSQETAPDFSGTLPGQAAAEAPAEEQVPDISSMPFVPMNTAGTAQQKDSPFISTISNPPQREPAPVPDTPEERTAPETRQAPPAFPQVHFGINDKTVYDDPVPEEDKMMNKVPAGRSSLPDTGTAGMDDMTVVDSTDSDSVRNFPENHQPKKEKNREEPKPEKEKKKAPEAKAKNRKTAAAKNSDPKAVFWQNILKLAGFAAGTVFLAIIAGAFLGGVGIVLIVLAAAVILAFLFSRGYITIQRPRKKQEPAEPPVAPDVGDVFTVRLRMISQNLATHQEMIIRENNQIIGSDPQVCRNPVAYRGVSRKHCKISCKMTSGQEEYYITDLGSKNGTQLNGETLEPNVAYSLKLGDHVTLAGKYDFKISSDAY